MKIGILTTHDSTNYGANLQAFALYQVLKSIGNDVIVIDRRRNPQGGALKYRFYNDSLPMHLRRLFGLTGIVQEKIHAYNTCRFQRTNMRFSSYHFHDWKDAPRDMGVDLLVVGSDQIWNKHINDPLDYMPVRFPDGLPAITYAASMGMPDIPTELVDAFKKYIPQFKAVSVRESNLQEALVQIGVQSKHVADPVVLLGVDKWRRFVGNVEKDKGRMFVYAFYGDILGLKRKAYQFAKGPVDLFPWAHFISVPSFRHPKSFLRNGWYWMRLLIGRGAKVRLMAGPKSWLQSLARSESVVTNSFHGFIFGVILGKNVRYVVPSATNRDHSDMLGRIIGYVDRFISGPLLQPSWEAAFKSIADGETIQVDFNGLDKFRMESFEWLRSSIESATCV